MAVRWDLSILLKGGYNDLSPSPGPSWLPCLLLPSIWQVQGSSEGGSRSFICRTGIVWVIVPGNESEIPCIFWYYLQSYGNNIKCHVKRAFMMLTIKELQTLDYVSMIFLSFIVEWQNFTLTLTCFSRKILFHEFTHCIIITHLVFACKYRTANYENALSFETCCFGFASPWNRSGFRCL